MLSPTCTRPTRTLRLPDASPPRLVVSSVHEIAVMIVWTFSALLLAHAVQHGHVSSC